MSRNKRNILDLHPDTTIVSRKSLFHDQDDDFSDENFREDMKMRLFERLNREVEIGYEIENESPELENGDDNEQNEQIFRLFACDPPTKISLESNDTRDYNEMVEQMRRKKADDDESRDDPDHMKRINSVTVTFEQIIQDSKIPWERHLIPHKVLYVPYKRADQKVRPKRRKSKKRRDAEKQVKKKNHGESCPGWPTGGKGYAYGWRSSIEQSKICIVRDSKSFRGKETNLNKVNKGRVRRNIR